MTVEDHIARVERTVGDLLNEIERLPTDALYREPKAGEWPVMSTLAHLSELLPYWAHQAAQVAQSPGTAFGRTHEDPDRLAAIEQYGRDVPEAMVARIRAALQECVATLRSIPPGRWSTVGNSPTRGSMSVEQIVARFIVDHTEEHAAQTHATLKALQTSAR